jgi:hypothetical protein
VSKVTLKGLSTVSFELHNENADDARWLLESYDLVGGTIVSGTGILLPPLEWVFQVHIIMFLRKKELIIKRLHSQKGNSLVYNSK